MKRKKKKKKHTHTQKEVELIDAGAPTCKETNPTVSRIGKSMDLRLTAAVRAAIRIAKLAGSSSSVVAAAPIVVLLLLIVMVLLVVASSTAAPVNETSSPVVEPVSVVVLYG